MAKKHHVTMRGVPIDMAAIVAKHGKQPALGNANMNARGDLLGKNGIILKTQEQIEAEWAAEKARQEAMVKPAADLKAPINVIVAGEPQPKKKMLDVDDADFDPTKSTYDPSKPASPTNIPPRAPTPNRRKIVDSQ